MKLYTLHFAQPVPFCSLTSCGIGDASAMVLAHYVKNSTQLTHL